MIRGQTAKLKDEFRCLSPRLLRNLPFCGHSLFPFVAVYAWGPAAVVLFRFVSPNSRFAHVYRAHDERSRSEGILAQLDYLLVCISHFRSAVEGISSPQSASP
jgi:hypothetical protein